MFSSDWQPAMPPHARKRSSPAFISGGHGEWSEVTNSTLPENVGAQRDSRSSADAAAGRTLRPPEHLRVFFGQREVVRASLAGNVHSPLSRRHHEVDTLARAYVHHVQRAAGLLGEKDRAAYSLQLRHDGTRVEVVAHRGTKCADGTAGEFVCDFLVLRMYED